MANRVVAIWKADWTSSPDTTNVIFDGWDIATGDDLIVEIVEAASDPAGTASNTGDNYAATYTSMSGMEAAENGSFASMLVKTFGNARSANGLWDTDAYILYSNSTRILKIDNDHDATEDLSVTFDAVQFQSGSAAGAESILLRFGAYHGTIEFLNCYIKQDDTGHRCFFISDNSSPDVNIKNCIITGGTEGIRTQDTAAFNSLNVYNCTLFGGNNYIATDNVTTNVKFVNNAVFNNDNDFLDSFAAGMPNYCASDDGDGSNAVDISPGATELDDWHDAFTDPDGSPPDVTIKDTDSVLYQAGQNQTADSEVPSTDIIGTTRPSGASAVSIGAFEFVSGGSYTVTVPDITGNTYIETFSLQQQHNLSLSDVTATTHISEITLSVSAAATLVVSDITSNTYIETFGIEQQHNLSLTDITSNTYIEAFSLDQVHNLSLSDITTTTHISEITLSVIVPGVDTLVVSDITGLTYISDTGLSQQHSLTVSDILQQNYIESVGLGVNHVLSVSDITVSTHIESPTLTYGYRIAPAGITVETSIDTLSLIQAYYLSIYGIAQGNYIESPTLSYSGTVSLGQVIDPYLKTTTVNRKLTTTTTAREIKTA